MSNMVSASARRASPCGLPVNSSWMNPAARQAWKSLVDSASSLEKSLVKDILGRSAVGTSSGKGGILLKSFGVGIVGSEEGAAKG